MTEHAILAAMLLVAILITAGTFAYAALVWRTVTREIAALHRELAAEGREIRAEVRRGRP